MSNAKPELALEYIASPTIGAFHECDDSVRAIVGPFGSGKSVGCVWEIMMRAMKQRPHTDKVRYTRFAVVRNTYAELLATTIKTWTDWFPEELVPLTRGSPIVANINLPLEDGTKINCEVFFFSMDKPKDVRKLKSLEVTGIWFNEWRELGLRSFLDEATARVGRYPPVKKGGATWSGVFGDTNPPDTDHWFFKVFEEEKPRGYRVFHQPPALLGDSVDALRPNPEAENVSGHIKGYGYWMDMCAGKTMEWIRVFVQGNYGFIMSGRPVYPEYEDSFHYAGVELAVMRGLTAFCGLDFGLNPSAAIVQLTPAGKLNILDELTSANMGIRRFATDLLKPLLTTRYEGVSVVISGDPAGEQRSQTDERTCYEILRQCGLEAVPVHTNDWTPRRDAVQQHLTRRLNGGSGLSVSARCPLIRKGFLGSYHYERVQIANQERYKDQPVKNAASHFMNALEYACMKAAPVTLAADPTVARRRVVVRNPLAWQ